MKCINNSCVLVVHGKYVWSHTLAGHRIRQQMTLHKLGMQSGNSTLALAYMWDISAL